MDNFQMATRLRRHRGALHRHLKLRRESLGMSQAFVAKSLNYKSAQIVSNWERGLCSPPYRSIKKLLKLYGWQSGPFIKIWLESERLRLERILSR